ncbi:TetR/AcrR family transcriptional regulator [Streptomyces sp. NPDC058001]|uniref:TetR/AcrR family transcriptional regulator n=1 Tax=Streptomyces sp. NPDC058001 TaxID=3346300 RepID=UPI0036F09C3A
MGHREDLLEGAKRCLLEKGFMRTTARDIVKESGTNLASIGYHYGSKDALVAQAFLALIEDVGDAFSQQFLVDGASVAPAGSFERFQEVWEQVLGTFPESRGIWALNLEFVLLSDRMPGVREVVVGAQSEGRKGLLPVFNGRPESELDAETIDTEGRFYQTILNGLVVQWLFDPASATSPGRLTEGLRRVADAAAQHPPAPRPTAREKG